MADYLLHESATVLCTHSASVTASSSNTRVKVGGQAVVTQNDTFTVNSASCPFQVGNKKQPCGTVKWLVAAKRVRVGGKPVLLKDSTGICQSAEQAPQGKPQITTTQTRVKGT